MSRSRVAAKSSRVILQIIQQIYHDRSTRQLAPNRCVHMDIVPFSNLSPSRLVDVPANMQPTPLQFLEPPRQDTTPCLNMFPRFIQNMMRRRVSQKDFCIFRDLGVDICARTRSPRNRWHHQDKTLTSCLVLVLVLKCTKGMSCSSLGSGWVNSYMTTPDTI